jgi:hypothetical protein
LSKDKKHLRLTRFPRPAKEDLDKEIALHQKMLHEALEHFLSNLEQDPTAVPKKDTIKV